MFFVENNPWTGTKWEGHPSGFLSRLWFTFASAYLSDWGWNAWPNEPNPNKGVYEFEKTKEKKGLFR